jgi:hypothetical protein
MCTYSNIQVDPIAINDRNGGAIITWNGYMGGSNEEVYVQKVDSSGILKWGKNGVAVSTINGDQYIHTITSDGQGGVIIGLTVYVYDDDIYAQRVDSSGKLKWTTDGVAICTVSKNQQQPKITSAGSGGAIITWQDERNGNDFDIYGQKIDSSGIVKWATNGAEICTAGGDQISPLIVGDGNGGAIITWQDARSNNNDVYAQKIGSDGTVKWATNGVAICIASGDQISPVIIDDGSGGAIITWADSRNGTDSSDIYAQRISSTAVLPVESDKISLPDNFELSQNYPNPFNPTTKIGYAIPLESNVRITIYNLLGQQVAKLVDATESAGYHEVIFNAGNLASGVYIYRIAAESTNGKRVFKGIRKLMLIK